MSTRVVQSLICPMDVEVVNESEYSHVLEVLPAEDGKSDAEVKAVTIAPFLGRHLYEHQVCGGVLSAGMRRDSFKCRASMGKYVYA